MKKEPAKKEEVEYKSKSGTAWSHSYLNQKPWHPLSYPNQRRKWIAEQTHAEHQRKSEEVSREFAQEQEFFRTSAMLSKKEREKLEVMQAVSFMYMRPPGYNAESARAAEIAEEKKAVEDISDLKADAADQNSAEGKKTRVKDLYGRAIPTEEEFPVLKNAPRMESGVTARIKPFAVEIRNVKCARCGAFGHQSGDRECPLKDSISTNEVARQKRDDPLTSIMTAVADEPLKWELKHQLGGLSPPRGGFRKDDPNQQIIPEDIYDEYGGFLAGGGEVQDILVSLPNMKHKKKKHRKRHAELSTSDSARDSDSECERRQQRKDEVRKKRKQNSNESDTSSNPVHRRWQKHKDKRCIRDSQSNSRCSDTKSMQRDRKRKAKKVMLDSPSQSHSDSNPRHGRHRDKSRKKPKKRERECRKKEDDFCEHHSRASF